MRREGGVLLGVLAFHFINSAILTAVVSIFVLWRYRTAVLKGMRRGDVQVLPFSEPPARNDDSDLGPSVAERLAWERRQECRLAFAYVSATLICALPLSLTALYLDGLELFPSVVLKLALVYTFACAPMIATSLGLAPVRLAAGVVALALVLAGAAIGGELIEGSLRHWDQPGLVASFARLTFSQLWLIALFWFTTWPRKVRNVAPVTFAALLFFGLAPLAASQYAEISTGTADMGENGVSILLALPAGWIALKRLQQVARGYQNKRFSDAQLLSRTWWLMLVANAGMMMPARENHIWLIVSVCTVALLIFAPLSTLLLSPVRQTARRTPARTLLLLRTFGHTWRTERLFDRIGTRWRMFGPVTMIAAPDVVARTVSAGDYLRWLTGRANELFVNSQVDLTSRLDALDVAPDPDGRYRVHAFCCHDNTWQATVVELIQRADAVVMDLRGATRLAHGCEFELQQLARLLAPQRLVMVIDGATERAILETAFGQKLSDVRLLTVHRYLHPNDVFEALLAAA